MCDYAFTANARHYQQIGKVERKLLPNRMSIITARKPG